MKKFKQIVAALVGYLALAVLLPIKRYAERALVFSAVPSNWPDVKQWLAHMSIDPNSVELIAQPLYDYLVYPTAGQLQFKFFQSGVGNGLSASPGNAGGTKTIQDTNLQGVGGQLPSPQMFWCDGIDVMFDAGSSAAANNFTPKVPGTFTTNAALPSGGDDDVNNVLTGGSLSLNIAEKNYYRDAPLYVFPPSASIGVDAAASIVNDNSAVVNTLTYTKARAVGMLNKLQPGVGLQWGVNFDVTVAFSALIATPSGFNGRLGVRMRGFQIRAVQ